jgi:FtsP/CotA-like multicopper oxidase with cupredoxin domain
MDHAVLEGHPVHPVAGSRFPLAMAQRLDILIDLPRVGAFPILARPEGEGRQTGIVLATAGALLSPIAESGEVAPPNLYHMVTGMMTEFRYQGIVI